jgi:hypothetical protein
MPIRINFLAEQQVRDEERRRDPVKRASYVAAGLVALLLAWGAYLQFQFMGVRRQTSASQGQFKQIEAQYKQALADEVSIAHYKARLESLEKLASTRVLWGSCLNALQLASQPQVRLRRLNTLQRFAVTPAVAARTNKTGVITVPRIPAISMESTTVLVDMVDVSPNPGEQVKPCQERIAAQPFFSDNNAAGRTVSLGAVMRDLTPGSLPYQEFVLEFKFQDRER